MQATELRNQIERAEQQARELGSEIRLLKANNSKMRCVAYELPRPAECAVACSHNTEEAQREYEDKCHQHEGVQQRLELVEKQAQHAGEQELLLTEY